MEFSRIEAGRVEAVYRATDLAALTIGLAGIFRSTIEHAGLRLHVDCPPLPELVYVDRDMWEKIVLNLLSNAFKFTFEGGIGVELRHVDRTVELRVCDSGVGIPSRAIPQLFERFYRVEGARGRSVEGSGIGLALVQELVRLHGGTVRVESLVGRGVRSSSRSYWETRISPRNGLIPVPMSRPRHRMPPCLSKKRSSGCRMITVISTQHFHRPVQGCSWPRTTPICVTTSPGCCPNAM